MSRISKWKLEKAKVKVVFRLQFHATHVPQAGWDKLFISFIPSDSGKVTAKTTKANGSSRSSVLGEAIINLADYTDALKPSIVALPLQGCSSGTILHVTVQLLTSKTGFREFEQQRELRDRGLQTGVDISSRDGSERVSSSQDMANDQTEKVNTRVRLRPEPKELPSLEEEAGLTEEYPDLPVGFDVSSNTSGSLYAEKPDNSSTHEIDSLNYSADNELAIAYEENNRLRGSLELAESTILELKLEVASLQNHADEMGIETQKFAQLISSEISSSEEVVEEISVMKLECSKLKNDLQHLISLKPSPQFDNMYQGIQLRWKKGLLVAEEKIREIQRKVYLSLDDREARLLHLDFEALLTILLELKQEDLPSEVAISSHKSEQYLSGLDVDLFHPPDVLRCLSSPSVSPQDHDSLLATKAMEDKIFELLRELDGSKIEREGMIRKMNEMECYYEALVVGLEENQKQMLVELQNLRNENSTCIYTVATTNAEIESIRRETNEQILRFSQERYESDLVCKEFERRAITSEAALKRARLNYSIAVDQLQKDLDLLSFQVLSMFETNKKLIRKTCSEGFQFHSENVGIKQQVVGGDVLLEDMKKSLLFQEELYLKVEQELSEMHIDNVYLDIFSKILQELFLQANLDITLKEMKIDELVKQLDLSAETKRLLTFQLQSAMNDMAYQNQILGQKSEGLANENFLLSEKIAQLETLLRDCSSYKTEYEVCSSEKAELANLLIQETVTKENLEIERSSLCEELELVKGEKSDLAQYNENLQKLVNSLEEKLGNLLKSSNEKLNGVFSTANTASRDLESVNLISVVSQLEEIQFNACEKSLQLLEEKKILEEERDRAQVLLSTAKSEIVLVKQKLEHKLQNVGAKLEASNALVENLQFELETLANKLQFSLQAEEKYVKQNGELLAKVTDLEGDLQHLNSKNMDLEKEILGMKTVTDELGRTRSTIDELSQEKEELKKFLENKDTDNAKLASELVSLKENFRFLHDEMHLERSSKNNLEGIIDHLTSQLKERNEQLLLFTQQEAELVHVRTRASDLELQTKSLEDERDQAQVLSSTAKSEIIVVKQKLEHELQNAYAKFKASNALVEKLQLELRTLANKLNISLEVEKKYGKQNNELLAKLADLEGDLQELTCKNTEFEKEIVGLKTVTDELGSSKLTIDQFARERLELTQSLENKDADNAKLASELATVKENFRLLHDELDQERSSKNSLQGTIDHLMSQLNEKNEQLFQFAHQKAELVHFRKQVSDLELQIKSLEHERDQAQVSSSAAKSEIIVLKQKLEHDLQNEYAKLEASNAIIEKFQFDLENLASKLRLSLEAEHNYANQDKELLDKFSFLEDGLQDLTSKSMEFAQEISGLNTVSEELRICKLTIVDLSQEREDLMTRFHDKALEIFRLQSEVDSLNKKLKFLHDELDTERSSKDNLQGTIDHLTSQLNENSEELLTKKKFEQAIRNMGAKVDASNALVEKLELELESFACKLQTSSEVEEKYTKQNEDLSANLSRLEGDLHDLASKNLELANNISCLNTVTEELENCKLALAELRKERQDKAAEIIKLESDLKSLKINSRSLHDELQTERSFRENLHGTVDHVTLQLNEKNNQLLRFCQQETELAHFRQLASDLECEISELHEYIISSDIKFFFMRSQYEMGIEELALNFDCSDKQLQELERKITEKPTVLSKHEIDCLMSPDLEANILIIFFQAKLNELKDQFTWVGENNDELAKLQRKCDELNDRLSEQVLKTQEFKNMCSHLKELKDKAEAESPKTSSSAEHESLRIAFIKEQYESKVQELRHQISVSKKHADDMLLKLQDSVDELESTKRSEAAYLRRNEELSLKVLKLEAELQSILSEKREKIKAYDLIKAELECALLSLEYCKEEKQKLEASLQEYSDRNHCNGVKERIKEDGKHSTVSLNVQSSEGILEPENTNTSLQQGTLPHNGPEHFAVINHRVKIQSLKSSMDHLQQELERMKNQNTQDEDTDASVVDLLQSELLQLNEANEELRTRFPMYNELPGNGNALERVFALEVELAEALQAKNKSNIILQSSFLKQHGDEQAMFQSFRDINELIKEMLELKGKHTSMEIELRDMHDRYSQLSLQLAEVEGERQKLAMTLKNSRSPKKFTLESINIG